MFVYKNRIKSYKKICEDLIHVFESNANKMVENNRGRVMTSVFLKRHDPVLKEYFTELLKIKDQYIDKYKFINYGQKPWNISNTVKIQKYTPGQSYYAWHAEVAGGSIDEMKRILVYSTFLNDIKEGGETEFYYQKQKIKPKQGRTILFPSIWTHTHKGLPAPKETKYIITGWYSYAH